MVGSNKILTVSYGTFSCTLEGFDDPFSAMRSIAEYFRDLAAEDRYFGAEPPTPDPEMLHRIAEREVMRRVEARTSPEGIVLRQIDDAEPEGPVRRPDPVAPARPVPLRSVAPRPAVAENPTPEMRDHERPAPESVVSKLSRIRAVVDRARTASVPAQPVQPPAEVAEDSLGLPEDAFIEAPPRPRSFAPAPEAAPVGDTPVPATAEYAAPDSASDEGPAPEAEAEVADMGAEAPETQAGVAQPWADATEEEPAEDDLAEPDAAMDAPAPYRGAAASADEVYEDDADVEPSGDDPDRPEAARAEAEAELDEVTLAGIRMALSAEKDALAQERKEARMERRNVLIKGDPDREPAFDRILEETNSKMQDREGSRRRSAIAHLKAAVAATKADRLLKRERSREIDEAEQRNYREDLAKVVRPHPSEPRESAAEKARAAAATGATPLVLGSDHRVASAPEAPVELRPRRVGAMIAIEDEPELDEVDPDRDESGFIAFAEENGARDLPDVLEAAAAYTAFVEGQASFSRPQIMRRAAAIETEEEFTREAGLRSFGQLLRQGKIRKLQRGQFTIAETTRFRPKARFAGE